MSLSRRNKIAILVAVVVLAALAAYWYFFAAKKAQPVLQPLITNVSHTNAVPDSIKGMLPDDVLKSQGAAISDAQVRSLSNGSEQSVLAYSSAEQVGELYRYFKSFIADNKLVAQTDSLGANQFFLSVASGGIRYNIFGERNPVGSGSLVSVSAVR